MPTRRELLEVTVSEYRNIGMCMLAEETIQTLVFIRAKRHLISATDMQRSLVLALQRFEPIDQGV